MLRRWLAGAVCLTMLAARGYGQEGPKPGPEHEKLKAMVGEWDATVKMEGGESKGTARMRLALNGMHLTQTFKADFGGMKFEGRGTTSYCPIKKKYVGTWIDNMTPSPMVMMGSYTDDKTFVEEGEGPSQEGKIVKIRTKSTMPDKDTMIFTMYQIGDDGKEKQTLQITYKRKS